VTKQSTEPGQGGFTVRVPRKLLRDHSTIPTQQTTQPKIFGSPPRETRSMPSELSGRQRMKSWFILWVRLSEADRCKPSRCSAAMADCSSSSVRMGCTCICPHNLRPNMRMYYAGHSDRD